MMTELAYIRMSKPHSRRLTRAEELAACKRGDFGALAASQLAWVVRVATYISRKYQFHDLEALVSAGNLALVQCLATYDAKQSRLTTYVYRKLYWAMASEIRKDYRGVSATVRVQKRRNLKATRLYGDDLPQIASEHDVVAETSRREEAEIVRNAIDTLPPREAEVIRRRFFDGMTLTDIGQSLGITKERVRQLEARAKRMLRERLEALE
jgi:RNA polymerase sigma factor (sigma-70 family)